MTLALPSVSSPWLERPKSYRDNDYLYLEYFASIDQRIYWDYVDRWQYQEQVIPFSLTSYNHEYLGIGTMDYFGKARPDHEVRREFAEQILRIRTDHAIRKYFSNPNRAPQLQRVNRAYHRVRSANMTVMDSSTSGQIKVAYDVISDVFLVEYSKGLIEVSCFHPYFVGALTGSKPKIELITTKLRTNFGAHYPHLTLSYVLMGDRVETSMTKTLHPKVDAELQAVHPTKEVQDLNSSYFLKFTYRF